MNVFGYKLVNAKEQEAQASKLRKELEDIKLSIGNLTENTKLEEAIKERRRTLPKPLLYKTNSPTTDTVPDRKSVRYIYYGAGYDLAEIGRAMDVEPYISQSIRKHREQIMKSGFGISSEDDELTTYLNQRLFEMMLVSGVTTEQWLREFVTNLVAFGTAFLVVKRDATRANGKPIRINSKTLDPIAALFVLDPTSVSVSINDMGYPVRWKQRVENPTNSVTEVIFDADDVIVATMDKKSGFIFGTPYILPVLDDVRTLRRLEELAELTAQRNTFPQIHYKVGTDALPAQVFDDGSDEVSFLRGLIESVSKEGGLVTNHRVEAEIIGGDRQVMDLIPYLDYFEARVLGGLRLSEVDIGRTDAAKASAVTVSQGLQDASKDFQSVICDCLTHFLLVPLALEGGWDLDPKENMPKFEFSTIDPEQDRADEAHGADLYMAGAVTHDEMRRDYLGKKPLPEEEKTKLKPEDDHAKALELGEQAGQQAIAKAKVSKSTSVKNKVANKSRPKNQHGRKASKTKVTKNSLDTLAEAYSLDCASHLWKLDNDIHEAICTNDPQPRVINAYDNFVTWTCKESRKALTPILDHGAKDCLEDMGITGDFAIPNKYIERFFKNYVEKSIDRIRDMGLKMIDLEIEKTDPAHISSVITILTKELKALTDKQIALAYRVGYARTARAHGYKTVVLVPDSDGWFCEDCGDLGDTEISLIDKNNSYVANLTTHGDCDFEITLGAK